MKKFKLNFKLFVLLILPAALLDTLNSIYNIYIPIYLQAGGESFTSQGATLTFGFGVGAALVGLWLTADNILAWLIQPLVGAWSDRSKSPWGRRIPFIIYTLPLVLIGYALIPVIPTMIPENLNGQQAKIIGLFLIFTAACIIYYLGLIPQRVILQTMRQEMVNVNDRSKIESWYTFAMYGFTIIALTIGSMLYEIYGPLLFWVMGSVYAVSTLALILFLPEARKTDEKVILEETSSIKQLLSVFRSTPPENRKSIGFFYASLVLFMIANSALANFASSWTVTILGISESKASQILSIYTIAATLIAIPAGYLAAGKFGRRNMCITGIFCFVVASVLLSFMPSLYIICFVLFGLGLGTYLVAILPLATELAGNQASMGSVVGLYNFMYMLGFLLGANLIGWIIQMTSYASFFPATSVILIASFFCALMVRPIEPTKELTLEKV